MVRVNDYCLRCNELVVRGLLPEDPALEDEEGLKKWVEEGNGS